jgi:ADP-heptose:LPS heptosyltransferase
MKNGKKLQETQLINFVLKGGAIGDYVTWLSAFEWIIDAHPHVQGTIFAPKYFLEIPQHHFARTGWRVRDIATITDADLKIPTFIPDPATQVNATGAHLLDMGFIYFCNRTPPPASHNFYIELELTSIDDLLYRYQGPLAVMTPGATSPTRQMPPEVFNSIKDYLLSRGVTPVFLGTTLQMTSKHRAEIHPGYSFEGGIDMIDQTSLLDAAKIMERAEVTIGLDNGLLHLAATTRCPIIYGHNVVEPSLRIPRRRRGGKILSVLPPNTPCRFCFTHTRFDFKAHPNECKTGTMECLGNMPFALWREAIDEVLDEQNHWPLFR